MEFEELGSRIDALYGLRQMRLEMQRKVDDMKSQEAAMRAEIRDVLDSTGLARASGQMATAGVHVTVEPRVGDWDEVYGFVAKYNRFDLLQRRISAPAWRELKESGILVPGTEAEEVVDISLTKSTR